MEVEPVATGHSNMSPDDRVALLRAAGDSKRFNPASATPAPPPLKEKLHALLDAARLRLGEQYEARLPTLQAFLFRYNIIRQTAPSLQALGPTAYALLEACGFESNDRGYLFVPDEKKQLLAEARVLLRELLREAAEEGQLVRGWDARGLLRQPRGAAIKLNSTTFPVGVFELLGRRNTMEDECAVQGNLFSVFDGHAGAEVAKLSAGMIGRAVEAGLKKADNVWEAGVRLAFGEIQLMVAGMHLVGGCTALVAQVSKTTIRMAHAGDSRAVLVRRGADVKRLTQDHKPDRKDEKKRIQTMGGRVVKPMLGKVSRINGELAVSRSIGDLSYVRYGLTHQPECSEWPRTPADQWLILCCDGVWDVMTDAQVGRLVAKVGSAQEAAEEVLQTAFKKMSLDNLSCIVVDLRTDDQRLEYL